MADRLNTIIERLRDKGAETLAFFEALAPDEWEIVVYTEGTDWTPREVMCHFVSAERAFLRIFEDVAAGGEGAPEGLDIDAFNEGEVAGMADESPPALLAQFRAARAATVAFLQTLTDADLDREGRHPWFGFDKIEKFVKLTYRHNMIHQRDIRRTLNGEDAA